MPKRSILTPRLAATIVRRVAQGLTVPVAAAQLGIHPQTVYHWCNAGRDPESGFLTTPDGLELAARFVSALAHAVAHYEWHQIRGIHKIAEEGGKEELKARLAILQTYPAYRNRYGIRAQPAPQGLASQQDAYLDGLSTDQLRALEGQFRELPPADEPDRT